MKLFKILKTVFITLLPISLLSIAACNIKKNEEINETTIKKEAKKDILKIEQNILHKEKNENLTIEEYESINAFNSLKEDNIFRPSNYILTDKKTLYNFAIKEKDVYDDRTNKSILQLNKSKIATKQFETIDLLKIQNNIDYPASIISYNVAKEDESNIQLFVDVAPSNIDTYHDFWKTTALTSDPQLGFTDNGNLKFWIKDQKNNLTRNVLKKIDSDPSTNYYRVWKVKDNTWNDSDNNIEKLDIIIDNSFDKTTNALLGNIYKNVNSIEDTKNIKPEKYTIFDARNRQINDLKTPMYQLEPTLYTYEFNLNKITNKLDLIGLVNKKLNNKNKKINLVTTSTKGLDTNNYSLKINNFYNASVLLKTNLMYKKHGQETWNESIINSKVVFKSGALINNNDNLFFISTNSKNNQIIIFISTDQGITFHEYRYLNLFNFDKDFDIDVNQFKIDGVDYISIIKSANSDQRFGKIYLIKNYDFENIIDFYQLDGVNKNYSFYDSSSTITYDTNNNVLINLLFEQKNISHLNNWLYDNNKKIYSKTIRIILDKN